MGFGVVPKRLTTLLAALGLFAALAAPASAQQLSLIRDAEVETIIRAYATPIFRAAGFGPGEITIYLVNDDSLNAFVAGGLNMFMFTGLLIKAEDAGQVIGVMAHETGHITGGHLARMGDAIRQAQTNSYVALILGAAAVVATGRADVGAAAVAGGAHLAQAGFLKYSRTQEASADQAGLDYLDQAGISARGLLAFFDTLEGQELLVSERQDPYLRSHPLNQDRMVFVRDHVENSPLADTPLPPKFAEMHARMRAKLIGFLWPRARVLRRYKDSDDSLESRYARAIAHYRRPDLDKALPLIDGLLAERPADPFFHELRGQMLFENGRIVESLPSYQEAVRLLPSNGLLRAELARVQLETNDPARNDEALAHLLESRRLDRGNPFVWRLLAIAYGRDDRLGMAALSLAEYALATGKHGEAKGQAERALRSLPKGSTGRQRAADIVFQTEAPG